MTPPAAMGIFASLLTLVISWPAKVAAAATAT
jgi:hypothetical protein